MVASHLNRRMSVAAIALGVALVAGAGALAVNPVSAFADEADAPKIEFNGGGDNSITSEEIAQINVKKSIDDLTGVDLIIRADDVTTPAARQQQGYQYLKSGAWEVLAPTQIVKLADVLDQAGVKEGTDWTYGKAIQFTATDGVYEKYYPSYAEIAAGQYFYPAMTNDNQKTVVGGGVLVEPVFAFAYGNAKAPAEDHTTPLSTTFRTAYAGSFPNEGGLPRFMMGTCESQVKAGTAMGKRDAYDITGITIIDRDETNL